MLRQVRCGTVWTQLVYIVTLVMVAAIYMELRVLRVGPPPVSSPIPEEVGAGSGPSCPEPAVVMPEVRVEHRTVQVERTVVADEAEVRKLGKLFATDKVGWVAVPFLSFAGRSKALSNRRWQLRRLCGRR